MGDDRSHELEEQEKDEILEEIDELVANNRLPVSEGMSRLKPQKSGVGFPLIINMLAVAAVISTFYFSNRLFEQKQEILSIENATYQSAEGRLLEELKRESAAKLEQKEQEINSIQDELAELDRQSRELVATMDQQIADREAELRSALEAELEEERRKLLSQGKSETDIEQQLKLIEAERSAEYEEELNSFREETERAIAEKEEELARARQLNEEMLTDANSEIKRIQDETSRRESELTARYEAEKSALAEEAAAAEAKLEQLSTNQTRESLIIDQINGSYENIFSLLAADRTEEALAQIEALRQLINDPGIAGLKAVTERAANDREMLEILREKIEELTYKEDVDTASLTAAADLLLSTREIASLGSEAYTAGNFQAAEDYYKRALGRIPALDRAWKNLEQISASNEADRINGLLQQADELAAGGETATAAEQYARAVASAATFNEELLSKALEGLVNSEETIRNSRIAEKDAAIAQLANDKDTEIRRLRLQAEETDRQLRSGISALNSDWEQKLAASRENYETEIETAKAEYEARIAEMEADYESRLSNADTSITSLEGEKNDEIERLTRLIGERDQENLRLNSEKEEAEASLSAAEKTISEGEAYIEQLKQDAERELEETKAALTEEIAALKAGYESGAEDRRSAASSEIEKLQSELASVEAELSGLKDQYNNQQESFGSRLRASEVTGYNNGIKQGRYNAFEDILLFTSYLDGTATEESNAENEISRIASTEPIYSETIEKIQELAAEGAATEVSALKQNILIGSISYASGDSIIVEPLTDIKIETGTRITIRRVERGKGETYITFGIVTSADENKISARTDPEGTDAPRSMDLVYITE